VTIVRADMMTKAQGRNLFGDQYPGVMGEGVVPLVPDMVRTIEEDNLPYRYTTFRKLTGTLIHAYQQIADK